MKFYDDTKPLYLETDASGVGPGAALQQMQQGTTCQKDTVPDNTILHPIVFASKSLTGAEQRYSNIEREALGIMHGLKKFHHYLFCQGSPCHYQSQTVGSYIKERCGNTIAVHTIYSIKNPSIQGPNSLQIWAWNIYCRLAVMTQPQRRKRQAHQRYGYKSRCHTKCNRHPGMHLHFTDSTHNGAGQTSPTSKWHYNYRLAQHKRWDSHWYKTILVL